MNLQLVRSVSVQLTTLMGYIPYDGGVSFSHDDTVNRPCELLGSRGRVAACISTNISTPNMLTFCPSVLHGAELALRNGQQLRGIEAETVGFC